jgi:hypothetical protein
MPNQSNASLLQRKACRHPAEYLRYIGEQKTLSPEVTLSLYTCELCRTTVSRRRADDAAATRQSFGPATGRRKPPPSV